MKSRKQTQYHGEDVLHKNVMENLQGIHSPNQMEG